MKKILTSLYILILLFILIPNKYSNAKTALNPYTKIVLVNKEYGLTKQYIPKNLVTMSQCLTAKPILLEKEAYFAYLKLFNEAKKKDINLIVYSGYRSYEYQEEIYNNEAYQAKPGHSEHQTGLALDITINSVGLIKEFEEYNAYDFLINNAYKYGFILRYPKDKENITKYPFEPWHFRFVGINVAKKIKINNWCLEEYYIKEGLL